MAYTMEELVPIVADLAQKETGYDSTSVTYEKAQMLMAAVIYCLEEYRHASPFALADKNLSAVEQYHIGARLVIEKATDIGRIFNTLSPIFDDYGVICLYDTVQTGIPEFLKWYDAKFCPQNTILTLDYPLLCDIHSLSGVDAIYRYVCAIQTEQYFLGKFDRRYVVSILEKNNSQYQHMLENVCGIVLMNTIGHVAIGKPLHDMGFRAGEYEQLARIFNLPAVDDIEGMIGLIIKKIVNQFYESDQDLLDYLYHEARNIAVRIHLAISHKQLDKIFVL